MTSKLRTSLLVAALVGIAVLLGGCASGTSDPAALEGTWALESFGAPVGLVPADPSVTSEITLKAGEAKGSGGVNSFSGTYEATREGDISIGPLAATTMAGPPEAMDQESEFFAALEAAEHYEFDVEKLVLSDLGNNTLVVLTPK